MTQIRNAAELSASVKVGTTTESLYLEFKHSAPGPLPKGTKQGVVNAAQMEIVADIIQFANADGGSILYGIDEGPGPTPGLKTAIGIASIQKPDELKQWIEQAIRNYCVPATFSKEVVAIDTGKGVVVAVSVPPSRHLVSLWDDEQHAVKYPKRTSHGQGWMNPDEAERHLMDGSRAARIALIDACKGAMQSGDGSVVELPEGLIIDYGPGSNRSRTDTDATPVSIGAIRDYSFDLKIIFGTHVYDLSLPFGVVREAWITHKNKVGMMLHVSLIIPFATSKDMWFEPR